MHVVARPLVLLFSRGTDAAPYQALEGTWGYECMVLEHKNVHVISEKASTEELGN